MSANTSNHEVTSIVCCETPFSHKMSEYFDRKKFKYVLLAMKIAWNKIYFNVKLLFLTNMCEIKSEHKMSGLDPELL